MRNWRQLLRRVFFGRRRSPRKAAYAALALEGLEHRCLPAATGLTEFLVPTANAVPVGLTSGPDGALWFTEGNADRIGRATTTGVFTEYGLPAGSAPEAITSGPDGALWFTEYGRNRIGRITTTGGLTEYTLPTGGSAPLNITAGPDGALWFTEVNANQIGRITTAGVVTEYVVPTTNSQPQAITAGPDGALWFTESAADKLGRITTGGVFTEYALPAGSTPEGISAGPDGALWFIENGRHSVGHITTAGVFTEYSLPAGSDLEDIASGPNGAMWFTDASGNKVGQITTTGVVTEYASPTTNSQPQGITTGPDGAVWFTESIADKLGRVYPLNVTAAPISAVEGTVFSGTVATVPGTAALTGYGATIDWGDGTTSTGTLSGLGGLAIGGTHAYAEEGTYTLIVTLQDGQGGMSTATTTAVVADAPLTPAGSVSPFQAAEGNDYGSQVVAVFADGGTDGTAADYSATISWGDGNTSAGTVTGNRNGTFSVSGDNVYAEDGTYAVSIVVHDLGGQSLTLTGAAQVAEAPFGVAGGGTFAGTEGTPVSAYVASIKTYGYATAPGEYAATIDWGDGQTSAATLTIQGKGTIAVTGSHTYAGPGSYTVGVQVADDGTVFTVQDQATVQDVPVTPSGPAVTLSAVEGASTGGSLLATFSDPGSSGNPVEYQAAIDWGDGSTSVGTVSVVGGTTVQVSGSHTYAEEGRYQTTVTLLDSGGASATAAQTTFAVADAGLAGSGLALSPGWNVAYNGPVASFTDNNPNGTATDFTATIDWGDGGTSPGTVSANTAGGFDVGGSHTYTAVGSYTVAVSIQDVGGAALTVNGTAQVSQLAAGGTTLAPTEGSAFSGTVASFSNPIAPGDPASRYSARIDWGDGQTSLGSITPTGTGTFALLGSHTYADQGQYTVATTITWSGGATATGYGQASVQDAAVTGAGTTMQAAEGVPFQVAIASVSDGNLQAPVADYSASIQWGDGQSSAGVPVSTGAGGFAVLGSHAYAHDGTYTATVAVTDAGGSSAQAAASVTVVEGVLTAVSAPATLALAAGASSGSQVLATFADANPQATAAQFHATVDWGDGTTSAGTVQQVSGNTFEVLGSHAWSTAGDYPVRVTVRDDGGMAITITSLTVQVRSAPTTGGATPQPGPLVPPPPAPTTPGPDLPPAPAPTLPPATLVASAGPPAGFGGGPLGINALHLISPADSPAAVLHQGSAHSESGMPKIDLPTVGVPSTDPGTAVAGTAPTPNLPRTEPSPPAAVAPARPSVSLRPVPVFHTEMLTKELDKMERQLTNHHVKVIEAMFATGAVATAGYVLLSSRAGLWVIAALTARPLWKQFDPIEILFAWEREKKLRGGMGPSEDEETLQSLVS
jgi:virginiamycin B lyase